MVVLHIRNMIHSALCMENSVNEKVFEFNCNICNHMTHCRLLFFLYRRKEFLCIQLETLEEECLCNFLQILMSKESNCNYINLQIANAT